MTRHGKVMRYRSSPPDELATLKVACPTCFTLMQRPEKAVFWPECPSRVTPALALWIQYAVTGGWWDTCSATSSVSPIPSLSDHFPMNCSPSTGLRGFFSLPLFSFLAVYCPFSVPTNQRRTFTEMGKAQVEWHGQCEKARYYAHFLNADGSPIRSTSSCPWLQAAKRSGFSPQ